MTGNAQTRSQAHSTRALRIKTPHAEISAARLRNTLFGTRSRMRAAQLYADQLADLGYAEIPLDTDEDAMRWQAALVAMGASVQLV